MYVCKCLNMLGCRNIMYVYMYACMHVCMYVCMHVCMYVSVYLCLYVCVICMYVRMSVPAIYACMHAFATSHTCVCGYMHTTAEILADTHTICHPAHATWTTIYSCCARLLHCITVTVYTCVCMCRCSWHAAQHRILFLVYLRTVTVHMRMHTYVCMCRHSSSLGRNSRRLCAQPILCRRVFSCCIRIYTHTHTYIHTYICADTFRYAAHAAVVFRGAQPIPVRDDGKNDRCQENDGCAVEVCTHECQWCSMYVGKYILCMYMYAFIGVR